MGKLNKILLIIFIFLACILNYLPHLNYKYPIHVDEWVHFQYANHLSNDSPLYFGEEYKSLEAGFHYLLATLNSFGIDYIFIFNYFSIIFTLILCLSIFVLTRNMFSEKAGVFAVFFIALLKSSATILGPALVVPMAIGMGFIAITLYLIKIESKAWVLILAGALIIHPPTATAIILLINIEFLIARKDYLKNLALQAISILIAMPLYLPIIFSKGVGTVNSLNFMPIINVIYIPRYLGAIVVFFVLAGIFFSVEKKKYHLAIYSIALLIFAVLYYWFEFHFFVPYERALMYLFVIFAVLFGLGIEKIISIPKDKKLKILVLVLIIILLAFPLKGKIDSSGYFYQIINNKNYADFFYIKDNTNKNEIAVLDPWTANAFTPIAERQVYSRITQGPNKKYEERNAEISKFFDGKCKDSDFLKKNNITIVYGNCNNSKLTNDKENIYFYKP
jgi:hypothetical protein